MGMVFGKINAETPNYELIKSSADYQIRKYSPAVIAEITYNPSEFKGDKDGGFNVLASYIGVFGTPQNTKPESIAMTTPVITKTAESSTEAIAMTVPVVTKSGSGEKTVSMQFVLPSKYNKAAEAPEPVDKRVVIKEEGERKVGVIKFSGVASEKVVSEKVDKLKGCLEKDGFKVVGAFVLARYNPPWTIPLFRINEVMIPVE